MAGTSVEHHMPMLDLGWRKRKADDDIFMEVKRTKYWYYKLESETSQQSEEDTESVYSIQDKETDIAKDTSDTETHSDSDIFEVQFEVGSSSGNEDYSSSASTIDQDLLEGAIAAVMSETSLEKWFTDVETSSDSSMDESDILLTDFKKCADCKSRNYNRRFRYCTECYQVRKEMFPPRPRRRSRRRSKEKKNVEQLETLDSYLKSISQDSGLGSSQDLQELNFKDIVVPDRFKATLTTSASSVNLSEISESFVNSELSDKKYSDSTSEKNISSEILESNCSLEISEQLMSSSDKSEITEKTCKTVKSVEVSTSGSSGKNSSHETSEKVPDSDISVSEATTKLLVPEVPETSTKISSSKTALKLFTAETSDQQSIPESYIKSAAKRTRNHLDEDEEVTSSSEANFQTTTKKIKISDGYGSFVGSATSMENVSQQGALYKHSLIKEDLGSDAESHQSEKEPIESSPRSSRCSSPKFTMPAVDTKELCMICNSKPKNGLFLHGKTAHLCCCYNCAQRTWKAHKRCPICNCRVNNIAKLFSA